MQHRIVIVSSSYRPIRGAPLRHADIACTLHTNIVKNRRKPAPSPTNFEPDTRNRPPPPPRRAAGVRRTPSQRRVRTPAAATGQALRERSEASAAREYSARSLRRKGLRSLRPQAALFSVRRASRKQPAAPHRRKGPERKSPLRTGGAMIHKTVCPRTARTPAGRPDAYMRSGTSMPSSPIAARSTRATCSASWRRMRRTAASSSRRIEWSW